MNSGKMLNNYTELTKQQSPLQKRQAVDDYARNEKNTDEPQNETQAIHNTNLTVQNK